MKSIREIKEWMGRERHFETGYLASIYDSRDWDYAEIASGKPLPKEVDLSHHISKTLYQGSIPSCVAHGVAHQLMIEEAIRGNRSSIPSRRYIYFYTLAQHQINMRITGTFPRLAYKAVDHLGCPPEELCKYSTRHSVLKKPPSGKAGRYAFGRRGLKYRRIKGKNRSTQIRQALADNHPVGIGTQTTPDWNRYKPGDILRPPETGEEIGSGHYTVLGGYKGDLFIDLNSWRGKERLLLHESYIEWSKSRDFWVVEGWR